MRVLEGKLVADGIKVGIVAARFNEFIVSKLASGIPVLFGVVTTENIEQAIERAGTKAGNKGYDCALSALEMVQLVRKIEE